MLVRKFAILLALGHSNWIKASFFVPAEEGLVKFFNGTRITSVSVANPAVVTCAEPHGYPAGLTRGVRIIGVRGGEAAINAEHDVTYISDTTFSIPINNASSSAGAGGFQGVQTDDWVSDTNVDGVFVSAKTTFDEAEDRIG